MAIRSSIHQIKTAKVVTQAETQNPHFDFIFTWGESILDKYEFTLFCDSFQELEKMLTELAESAITALVIAKMNPNNKG